jgi:hypothetical protein
MLQQLLQEIRAGSVLENQTLAVRLNTTPQMVAALLEHLQRAGYLRPYADCGDGCQGCALKTDCAGPDKAAPRLWTLAA